MIAVEPNAPAVVADLDEVVKPGDNLLCYRRNDGSWHVATQRSAVNERKTRVQFVGSGPDFASAINDLASKL